MILPRHGYNHVMINQHRLRRDLAWCLQSPALLANERWCEQLPLDVTPISLPAPAHPHRFRLGQQFERLLLAWLEASDRYQCLYHNLQVQDGKRTLGEFDFLVRSLVETSHPVEHWEAAVKFYLGTGDLNCTNRWFGPNTADRLDLKLDRLAAHQLRLGQDPVARALLADLDINISRVRCLMKGRLFHPWRDFIGGRFIVPDVISPDHGRGWWISYADFLRDFEPFDWRYAYLPKSCWLAQLVPEDINNALSFMEVVEMLGTPGTEQAVHLAVTNEAGEIHRGFVVNDHWLMRVNDFPGEDGSLS
ncbi:MAG: DUF1853 family protein [Pseudomonadota bacterium]